MKIGPGHREESWPRYMEKVNSINDNFPFFSWRIRRIKSEVMTQQTAPDDHPKQAALKSKIKEIWSTCWRGGKRLICYTCTVSKKSHLDLIYKAILSSMKKYFLSSDLFKLFIHLLNNEATWLLLLYRIMSVGLVKRRSHGNNISFKVLIPSVRQVSNFPASFIWG